MHWHLWCQAAPSVLLHQTTQTAKEGDSERLIGRLMFPGCTDAVLECTANGVSFQKSSDSCSHVWHIFSSEGHFRNVLYRFCCDRQEKSQCNTRLHMYPVKSRGLGAAFLHSLSLYFFTSQARFTYIQKVWRTMSHFAKTIPYFWNEMFAGRRKLLRQKGSFKRQEQGLRETELSLKTLKSETSLLFWILNHQSIKLRHLMGFN